MRFATVASCAVLVITAACSDRKHPGITDSVPIAEAPGADLIDDLQTRVVPSLPADLRAEVAMQLNVLAEMRAGDAVYQRNLTRTLAFLDRLLEQRSGSAESVDLQSIRLGVETIMALQANH
jgi:hypothetical protein